MSESSAGTVSCRAGVERQHLPGYLGPDGACVIVVFDMTVACGSHDRKYGVALPYEAEVLSSTSHPDV